MAVASVDKPLFESLCLVFVERGGGGFNFFVSKWALSQQSYHFKQVLAIIIISSFSQYEKCIHILKI